MKLSFHGAAQGVTGSCHLLECAGRRILVDCGMFQGGHELDEENSAPFGFEPDSIDILLLTHAHLDHCGRIPLLVRKGFRGEIITTAASRELARLVLLDSAHLHEEEARRQRHHGKAGTGPLYGVLDALNSFDQFGRIAEFGAPIDLGHGIRATFHDAGHILGSASVLIEAPAAEGDKRILFSGDIGNAGRPLLRDPRPPGEVDAVVMETTYGDRNHRPLDKSVAELRGAVRDTLDRGGNVVIPTFALERAQELLFYLREAVAEAALDPGLRVYLDSPMAISATEIFRHHPEAYRPEVTDLFRDDRDPFGVPGLEMVREASDSMKLNDIRAGAVLMAGSGMCTGGRVRHHLRHNLARSECSVIFVGFAAEGTLARILIDGADKVKLFGDWIPVRGRIHTINGFSAHADRDELLDWHRATGKPATTFLVHGEPDVARKFGKALKGTEVRIPAPHQSFTL